MIRSIDMEYPRSQQLLAVLCAALPGLFLLITSTTFLVEEHFVYDIKRILQLCLILALFMATGFNAGIRGAFELQLARIPRWLGIILGLIVSLGIISSFVSATSTQQAINSLLEVALLSLLVLSALVLAACRTVAGKLFDQVVISLLALAGIAVGLQEILGVMAALANQLEFFARISLMHYSWPRFYNQVQAWVLPALGLIPLIWAGSNSDLLRARWFQAVVCLGVLLLHWYIILMTGGRGVAISLVFTFVVCLIFFPAIRKTTLHWHLPGLLLGILLFVGIAHVNDRVQSAKIAGSPPTTIEDAPSDPVNTGQRAQESSNDGRFASESMSGRLSLDSSGRLSMWRDAVSYIREAPALGIGPMNYACVGPLYRAGHPHNFALQFAAEWGLPATLGLVGVVVYLLMGMWNSLRKETGRYEIQLGSMLATGLLAAAVYSCLSGVIVMPASQVMGILIGGWLLGTIPLKQPKQAGNVPMTVPLVVTTLLISGSMTVFSFIELGQREYRESIIATLDQGIPRYWQQGKQCKYFDQY